MDVFGYYLRFLNPIQWAEDDKNRDGRRCVRCGSTDRIQAHHRMRKSEYPIFALCRWNGETLCYSCHRKVHREAGHGDIAMIARRKAIQKKTRKKR